MEYLFVYDSLRTTEGHPMHNYLRARCDYLGAASIGGTTIEVEDRVGLLLSGNPDEQVEGELYRIHEGASDELFGVLDRYEGCSEDDPEPHEFFRHRREVTLYAEPSADREQQVVEAWVYIYNG